MHIFYNDQYVAPSCALDTTRKSRLIAEKIGLDKVIDPSLGEAHAIEQICDVLDIAYLAHLPSRSPN